MKIEDIVKYEGKQIILNLINKFSYRGKITKINDGSFEFTDMYNNSMTIDPSFVGMIIPDKGEKK